VLIFLFGCWAKQGLPEGIGQRPELQLPCAFFSAVLVPFGSLLAFRQLIAGAGNKKALLFYHLGANLFLIGILSLYFFESTILKDFLQLTQLEDIQVKLAAKAVSASSEHSREISARYAYRLYGAIIAYRSEDSQLLVYKPTAEDEAAWRDTQATNRTVERTRELIKKSLLQIPYLVGLYAGTFATAYLIGGAWIGIRAKREAS